MRCAILGIFLLAACGGDAGEEQLGRRTPLEPRDFGRTEEVRDYLATGGAVWSEDIPVSVLKTLARDLYFSGARKVLFAGIEDFEGTDITAWLVVELPEESPKRKDVFEKFNAIYAEYTGRNPVRDIGQTHIDVALD